MKTKIRLWVKIILPLLVLGVGYMGFKKLSKMKQRPKLRPPVEQATPVVTVTPIKTNRPIQIDALGTLVPARSLAVQAEVTGLATFVSSELVPGGLLKKNVEIIRIDARDYRLAIRQRKAQLASAEVVLQQEQSRQAVAQREWKILGTGTRGSERGRRLAMREPQIQSAEAGIDAAESSLAAARLALVRTKIKAPFNAVVRNENVETGQRVGPGQALATLVGTDEWWVQVSVPMSALKWLQIPGSLVDVMPPSVGDWSRARRGRVIRTLPDVDSGSQMARIVVEIPDPLALKGDDEPLLLGATTQVRITGKRLENVLSIPREALRRGNEIWLVDENNQLVNRPVKIIWRERTHLLVSGLNPNDQVISSPLAGGTPGMKLRILKTVKEQVEKSKGSEDEAPSRAEQATVKKSTEERIR